MCKNAVLCKNLIFDPSLALKGKDKPYPDCLHYSTCKTMGFRFFEDVRELPTGKEEVETRLYALSNFTKYVQEVGTWHGGVR